MKNKIKSFLGLNNYIDNFSLISQVIQTEKVSVLDVFKYLFSFWRLVLISGLIFLIVGLIFSIEKKSESYTSISVIIPGGSPPPKLAENTDLEGLILAQMASSTEDLGIESFPGIIENYPFLLNLLNEKILSEKYSGYLTVGEYLAKMNEVSKLDSFIKKIKNVPNFVFDFFEFKDSSKKEVNFNDKIPTDTLTVISSEKFALMDLLLNQVIVEGNNPVTITTLMPEAKVSTRLNNLVYKMLVDEVTRIKTAKLQRDLSLNKIQLEEAKSNFVTSQRKLADFRDANKGNNSAFIQSNLERLNTEYSLYASIYSSLATEYELSKLEIVENTPYFDVVEPAFVPFLPDKSSIVNFNLLLKFTVLGIGIAIIYIVVFTIMLIISVFKERTSEPKY
uniref:hypothetical protein n=1 Tax=Algoriphagus sp. TaxID=1872435 RepID=UPI004048459B